MALFLVEILSLCAGRFSAGGVPPLECWGCGGRAAKAIRPPAMIAGDITCVLVMETPLRAGSASGSVADNATTLVQKVGPLCFLLSVEDRRRGRANARARSRSFLGISLVWAEATSGKTPCLDDGTTYPIGVFTIVVRTVCLERKKPWLGGTRSTAFALHPAGLA